MRAADTDRIQVAQLLTDAAAQGQLQMSEYEDRLTRAYAAQTYDELDRISADLPGTVTRARGGGPCRPAPSTLLLAIMSGFERRGRWNVPRRRCPRAREGSSCIPTASSSTSAILASSRCTSWRISGRFQ